MTDNTPAPISEPGSLIPLGESAVEMKKELAGKRAESTREIARAKAEVETMRAQMEERRKAMELEFAAQRAEIEATMAPLLAQLKQLEEMSWTVDLYLGRDEQLDLIREGESAPADETTVLRQMVLAADEESLVHVETGGIDARGMDEFIDWMVSDVEHLNRIIPDQKGIVVLRATRQKRNYGDIWTQQQMDEANAVSHWIIRNGERVYRLITNIDVGDRLLPTHREFVDYFYSSSFGSDPKPMEPGSSQWLKAEAAANAKQRHYMRIMLILQGLADRTVAFEPKPEGGLNFMSLESQDSGKIRIINELDNVLTSGREPFTAWRTRLNAKLRPGMRIIGDFGTAFADTNTARERGSDRFSYYKHSRVHPATASRPASNEIYLIEDRAAKGGLVIRYQREDRIYYERGYDSNGNWHAGGEEDAKVRASCTLYPDDGFILPFDLITAEEIRTYLEARTERHGYLSMIPVLRAALAAKLAEEEAEAPFLLMLAGVLAAEHGVGVDEVETELPELVRNWKIANRWGRPLVSPTPEEQSQAVSAISREFAARRKAATGSADKDAAVLATAKTLPGVIAVGRRRDGKYAAFAPSAPDQDVWLDEYRINSKGKLVETRRWTLPTGRSLAALTMLSTTEEWETWDHRASRSEHYSGPEASAFAERYLFPNAPGPAIALTHKFRDVDECTGQFRLWAWKTAEGGAVDIGKVGGKSDLMVEVVAYWKRNAAGEMVVVQMRHSSEWSDRSLSDFGVRNANKWLYSTPEGSVPGRTRAEWAVHHAHFRSDRSNNEVLVWSDDVEFAAARRMSKAIRARQERDREAANAIYRQGSGAVDRVKQVYLDRIEAERHARFVEDFATTDPELWANHRKSLKEPVVGDSRDLVHAVAEVMQIRDVTGMTLEQVVELSTPDRWDRKPSVPEDLAGIPIPPDPTPVLTDGAGHEGDGAS